MLNGDFRWAFFNLLTAQRSPTTSDHTATVIKYGIHGSSDPNDNLKRKKCLSIFTVVNCFKPWQNQCDAWLNSSSEAHGGQSGRENVGESRWRKFSTTSPPTFFQPNWPPLGLRRWDKLLVQQEFSLIVTLPWFLHALLLASKILIDFSSLCLIARSMNLHKKDLTNKRSNVFLVPNKFVLTWSRFQLGKKPSLPR